MGSAIPPGSPADAPAGIPGAGRWPGHRFSPSIPVSHRRRTGRRCCRLFPQELELERRRWSPADPPCSQKALPRGGCPAPSRASQPGCSSPGHVWCHAGPRGCSLPLDFGLGIRGSSRENTILGTGGIDSQRDFSTGLTPVPGEGWERGMGMRDGNSGCVRVCSQPARKREERADGLGWIFSFSCFSGSFLAVLPLWAQPRRGEEGWGQRQREVEPHSMEQGVGASRSTDQGISVLALPQFYSLLTPSTAFHVDFSSWVPRAWCKPPKTSPFVHPKSRREWPGGSPGPEARDGCRDRSCGSRLSAHAWDELRGEAGKDRIQVPGEHGFGSVEKSGLLQTPSRVAGMVLVRRGRWVRPVID